MTDLRIAGGAVLGADGAIEDRDVVIDQDAGTIVELTDEPTAPSAASEDEVLDASDALVLPGFVNAHTHLAMTLLRGFSDDKALQAWLEEDVWPIEGEMTPEDVEAGAKLGVLEAIKCGTTAVCDMYFHEDRIAEAVIEGGLKATLGYGVVAVDRSEDEIHAELETAADFADRYQHAGEGRIQTAIMPHAMRTVPPDVLADLGDLASEHSLPVHFHLAETRADVDAVTQRDGHHPVATAAQAEILANGFGAHGVHLTETAIDQLAAAGTGIAHCPSANLKLASGAAPIADLLAAGVPVGIGTDGPASNNDLDMIEEMRMAALLAKHREGDPTAVPAETALRMATAGGADLLGLEGGTLEAGAPADVAVIDLDQPHLTPRTDLISHVVYAANGADVRHTVCDGRILMADREVRPFDEAAVKREANERASALFERATGR